MADDDAEPTREQISRALAKIFRLVELWRERTHSDPPSIAPGSSLSKDDACTSPHQLSHSVQGALVSAVDHFETFRALVQQAGVLPARAGLTLLRAALENAAVAVWLLAPTNRNERVLRLLRLEWANASDHEKALNLLGTTRNTPLTEFRDELRALARARGLPDEQVDSIGRDRPVSFGAIVKTAGKEARATTPGQPLTADLALLAWNVSSAIAHNRLWGVLLALERIESPSLTDDSVHLELKADERWILLVAGVAAEMLNEGWRLLDQRRQRF